MIAFGHGSIYIYIYGDDVGFARANLHPKKGGGMSEGGRGGETTLQQVRKTGRRRKTSQGTNPEIQRDAKYGVDQMKGTETGWKFQGQSGGEAFKYRGFVFIERVVGSGKDNNT